MTDKYVFGYICGKMWSRTARENRQCQDRWDLVTIDKKKNTVLGRRSWVSWPRWPKDPRSLAIPRQRQSMVQSCYQASLENQSAFAFVKPDEVRIWYSQARVPPENPWRGRTSGHGNEFRTVIWGYSAIKSPGGGWLSKGLQVNCMFIPTWLILSQKLVCELTQWSYFRKPQWGCECANQILLINLFFPVKVSLDRSRAVESLICWLETNEKVNDVDVLPFLLYIMFALTVSLSCRVHGRRIPTRPD
jgi:hypothetical protein